MKGNHEMPMAPDFLHLCVLFPFLSFRTLGLLAGVILIPSLALADGFRNPIQDTAAIAQEKASRAEADNPPPYITIQRE